MTTKDLERKIETKTPDRSKSGDMCDIYNTMCVNNCPSYLGCKGSGGPYTTFMRMVK